MQDFQPGTTSRRTYDLDGGQKVHAERKDPYGFVYLHLDKGILPQELSSAFTSYDEADRAITHYVNKKQREVLSVKEK